MAIFLKPKNVHRAVQFMNSKSGGKLVPYGPGSKIIKRFCNSRYAGDVHFRNRIRLLEEFLAEIKDAPTRDTLLPDILISNFLRPYRSMSLSRLSATTLKKKYLKIEGLEAFDEAVSSGKGVVLVSSHFGFAESALTVFPILGYRNFYTVVRAKGSTSMKFAGLNTRRKPNIIVFKDHSNAELFKIMFKAREVLKEGGIFHILGDGYHGKSSITMEFLGRVRGFRGSFAELGLSTEAVIIPIFITSDNNGKLTYHMEEPLDKGPEEMEHNKRVEYIVRQYKILLEQWWKKEPQHINWGFMEKYLRQVHSQETE